MKRKTDKAYLTGNAVVRSGLLAMALMMMLLAVFCFAGACDAFADSKELSGEKPIREVHKVKVGDSKYCFFVTHNVVLIPEDIEGMTDEELTEEILEQSGLFMRQTNCKKPSHGIITVNQWKKKDKEVFLSEEDLNAIRTAEPVDGEPVKLHMDLRIRDGSVVVDKSGSKAKDSDKDQAGDDEDSGQDEEGDEEEEEEEEDIPDNVFSTFKRTSPRVLFMAIATPVDAAYGEDICVEDKKDPGKDKPGKPDVPGGKDKKEMLPEYRTISMVDRSGGPLEDTLKDGDPVSLEWIEPSKHQGDGQMSLIDRIPGGAAGLVFAAVLILAAFAAAVFAALKHRKNSET